MTIDLDELERLAAAVWTFQPLNDETATGILAVKVGLPELIAEVRRLTARVAQLEGALRAVEWTEHGCQECWGNSIDGHRPDCIVGAALGEGT